MGLHCKIFFKFSLYLKIFIFFLSVGKNGVWRIGEVMSTSFTHMVQRWGVGCKDGGYGTKTGGVSRIIEQEKVRSMELVPWSLWIYLGGSSNGLLFPGKSRGRRSLVGCSPQGLKESDTTEQLHFHFSLSCIGEGNGNPLQCSCLENSRDGGAWWAAVYGAAQSRTWLKRLSSSSSNG